MFPCTQVKNNRFCVKRFFDYRQWLNGWVNFNYLWLSLMKSQPIPSSCTALLFTTDSWLNFGLLHFNFFVLISCLCCPSLECLVDTIKSCEIGSHHDALVYTAGAMKHLSSNNPTTQKELVSLEAIEGLADILDAISKDVRVSTWLY